MSSRWLLTLVAVLTLVAPPAALAQGAGFALRFFGQGVAAPDADRVKIRVDDPATALPGPPADVGATDFTIEFWVRGMLAANPAQGVGCGAGDGWIAGNVVLDRDRYLQPRKFGISFGAGRVAFGVTSDAGATTLCGTTLVLDGAWHHVAVQRRRSDGRLWIFVDGGLQAEAAGPAGDVSYPDDGVPGPYCGGPCTNSDPFLVIGAEKHDAGPAYPSFNGWVDELRLSRRLRYTAPFARPTQPFVPDADTAALYHFDEGQGDVVRDLSGAVGGPSDGLRRTGGALAGPAWVVSDAPLAGGPPPPTADALTIAVSAATFRPGTTMTVTLRATAGVVAVPVDAYAVVQLPGGEWLSLQLDGRLVPGLVPLARGVVVPDAALAFAFVIPPGTPPGPYAWIAAVTTPGTLVPAARLVQAAFAVAP